MFVNRNVYYGNCYTCYTNILQKVYVKELKWTLIFYIISFEIYVKLFEIMHSIQSLETFHIFIIYTVLCMPNPVKYLAFFFLRSTWLSSKIVIETKNRG